MRWRHPRTLIACFLVTITIGIGGFALAGAQTPEATPDAYEAVVVRDVLSAGTPAAAPEVALELVQYTIPPHIELPVHTHPGMQVSEIVSGTLHYTVVEGEMTLYRAGATEPEIVTPEDGEVALTAGDAIVEPGGMIHQARNAGDEPIVILTASLLEADEAPAEVVATPAA